MLGSWSVCWECCVRRSLIVLNLVRSQLRCLEDCDREILKQTWKSLEHFHHFPPLFRHIYPHLALEPWAASSVWRACVASALSNNVHIGCRSVALQLRQLLFVQCSAVRSSINSPFCGTNWITANRGTQILRKTKVYPSSPLYLPSFVARLYKCWNINSNIQPGEYQWYHIGAALPERTFQLQYWTCAVQQRLSAFVILTVAKSLLGKVCCCFVVVWWADSYCAVSIHVGGKIPKLNPQLLRTWKVLLLNKTCNSSQSCRWDIESSQVWSISDH